jgi:hypothetical protein
MPKGGSEKVEEQKRKKVSAEGAIFSLLFPFSPTPS